MRCRCLLGIEAVRIRLIEESSIRAFDNIFVEVAFGKAGDKALPDAAAEMLERIRPRVPAVEIAYDMDAFDFRRPYGEMPAFDFVLDIRVRTELLPAALPHPASEQIEIVLRDDQTRFQSG